MKLGSAISQLISAVKRKQGKSKQRLFDIWKLQTLIGRQRMQNINDSHYSSNSGMIQIIHQTRPILFRSVSLDSFDSGRDLILRKALACLVRFKSRQLCNKFFNWKYARKLVVSD